MVPPDSYDWIRHWSVHRVQRDTENNLLVQTPRGVKYARIGDYIVRGIYGGFYPVSEDLFAKSHMVIGKRR